MPHMNECISTGKKPFRNVNDFKISYAIAVIFLMGVVYKVHIYDYPFPEAKPCTAISYTQENEATD